MAEGGDLTSIKDGSDADFVYTCSPCGDENVTEEAVKYCPACEEYLCSTCLRHHGRLKATRSHTVQDCDASTKESTVTMVTKCRYHPDRDIEMYCGEHDMAYCTKCIATNHRFVYIIYLSIFLLRWYKGDMCVFLFISWCNLIGYLSRGHEILCRGHELLCSGHDLVTRGHEIANSWPRDTMSWPRVT
jgi:hypothetical protein